MNHSAIHRLPNEALLVSTRELAAKSCAVEAELLAHLGEVDARQLYAPLGHSSMFVFCTHELGFSEGAASNRILVARAARRLPAMLEAARTGRVHITGLRLLAPHLTAGNCDEVLASAAGKTKEQILELAAKLAPRPAVEMTVRKLPTARPLPIAEPLPVAGLPQIAEPLRAPASAAFAAAPRPPPTPVVPLAEDLYKIQLSAPRAFKDKLKQAQDLADADVLTVLSEALDLFLEKKLKARIGAGKTQASAVESESRHIPAAIRREVWQRDGGRCAFIGAGGTRCTETRALEFDTSRASRGRTDTTRRNFASSAAPTTNSPRTCSTAASSWNATAGVECAIERVPEHVAPTQAKSLCSRTSCTSPRSRRRQGTSSRRRTAKSPADRRRAAGPSARGIG